MGVFERAASNLEDEKRSKLNLQRMMEARQATKEREQKRIEDLMKEAQKRGLPMPLIGRGFRVRGQVRRSSDEAAQNVLLAAEKERKIIKKFRRDIN